MPGSAHPPGHPPTRRLFQFHGKVKRISIEDGVGYVEFQRASASSTALMFDQTQFLGQKVSVKLSAGHAWSADAWTPSSAAAPAAAAAAAAAAAPAAASASAAAAAAPAAASPPAAAAAPPPRVASEETFEQVEHPAVEPPTVAASSTLTAAGKKKKAATPSKPAPEPAVDTSTAAIKKAREEALAQLAAEPLNSPLAILGLTFFALLLMVMSS